MSNLEENETTPAPEAPKAEEHPPVADAPEQTEAPVAEAVPEQSETPAPEAPVAVEETPAEPAQHACPDEAKIYARRWFYDKQADKIFVEGPVCEHEAHSFPDGSLLTMVEANRRGEEARARAKQPKPAPRPAAAPSEDKPTRPVPQAVKPSATISEEEEAKLAEEAKRDEERRDEAEKAKRDQRFADRKAAFAGGTVEFLPSEPGDSLVCSRKAGNERDGSPRVCQHQRAGGFVGYVRLGAFPLCTFDTAACGEAERELRNAGKKPAFGIFRSRREALDFARTGKRQEDREPRGGGTKGGLGKKGEMTFSPSTGAPGSSKGGQRRPETEEERAEREAESKRRSEAAKAQNAEIAAAIAERLANPDAEEAERLRKIPGGIQGLREIMEQNAAVDARAAAKRKQQKGGKKDDKSDRR